jgi:LmbE family N-acetylglucosaminyl deacetylase
MSDRIQGLKTLFAFAHPDDEGFATGGTLAMLVHQGAHITLVCATNGDVGEISDPSLATPATLGQVRQEELRCAMAITGVQDIRFLNYRDSGMVDTADNHHPNARRVRKSSSPMTPLAATATQTIPPCIS